MMIEFFIMFQIILIIFFIVAFILKHEIFWSLCFIISIVLMLSSLGITKPELRYDDNIEQIGTVNVTYSVPLLLYFNLLLFMLTIFFLILDLFDKYSVTTGKSYGGL